MAASIDNLQSEMPVGVPELPEMGACPWFDPPYLVSITLRVVVA
jgi:hypothetical protein